MIKPIGLSSLLLSGLFCGQAAAAPSPAAAPRVETECVPALSEPSPAAGVVYFADCEGLPQMAALPPGDFEMGDLAGNGHAYERPAHVVHVPAFAIGRYEVTSAQWALCVAAAACEAAASTQAGEPVSGVSWQQAGQYAGWLTRRSGKRYRLPSEAEWEYAARAGTRTQFSWGNPDWMACRYANAFDLSGQAANPSWTWSIGCDDGYARQAPVGRYPANAWGLYDMLGNLWEWVADCWHGDYRGAPADGSAWVEDGCRKRVNRGGGWGNHPRALRVSNRDGDDALARSDGLGFRVARDAR